MPDNKPLISILMVTYNAEKFIATSVTSVLSQTYRNIELIICDDNSIDGTWDIINRFEDSRIVKVRNEQNLREYPNRSKAAMMAKGQYALFLDGDDLLYENGIELLVGYAARYLDCGMVLARPWDERIVYPKSITPHQFYCFEYLDEGVCGINFTKVLFNTAALQQSMPFPDHVKLGDLYIQYKIALTHESVVVPDAATWWRRNRGQASEALLNNMSLYLLHELWIKLDMLNDSLCPLNKKEKETALQNVYGAYIRHLIKLILKGKIREAHMLHKKYPVPGKYWKLASAKQQRNYFREYSGNNPLAD